MKMTRLILPVRRKMRSLARDANAVAMVEFAFTAPVLLLLGLGGMELAYAANMHMRVSQLTMQIADNASRLGDKDALAAQRVFEGDVLDALRGADIQAGDLDLFENGRVIISSLEQNADGGQWIHWQRCMGKKVFSSAYGTAGTGELGTAFAGMGVAGEELKAPPNGAVMYVEVSVDYESLTKASLVQGYILPLEIKSEAAFTVRSARDLERLYDQPGVSAATCDKYEAF
ncbi:TadE/TadG family type IV pilus assembly protein [Erythrobacter ani]|uniref:Pilus assembly protein n=1 Tax=Erythrobacter ani TaxID=2827235 RepID=A0ABS6SML4_9SPHN|nr:TadE/TadG family type IV pilus assembly protein [Erythrobacter ani]MBV7266276.1 pilus assembly protein [Erythrobacter ani]